MPVSYETYIDWDGTGSFEGGTATAAVVTSVATGTRTRLIGTTADTDAAFIVGAKVQIYLTGGTTLKHDRVYTLSELTSGFGFTNLDFYPPAPLAVANGDVMKVVTPTGDDVSGHRLKGKFTIAYGKDTARALGTTAAGSSTFDLNNSSREYYPTNTGSTLYGRITPARPIKHQCQLNGTIYSLYRGYTDDFNPIGSKGRSTVPVECTDALGLLGSAAVSTPLHRGIRSGTAIGYILDAVGWPPSARDIDPGSSVFPWWWEEGTGALEAMQKVINSEGPPASISVDPAGNFVYRDRHHRLVRTASLVSQATFADTGFSGGGLIFESPLTVNYGFKDIINRVELEVPQRKIDVKQSVVWSTEDNFQIADGEIYEIDLTTSEPFMNAVVPVSGTDFTLLSGSVTVSLRQTSGGGNTIYLKATGGAAVVANMQLRATSVPVARTIKVYREDAASKLRHGLHSAEGYSAPWANGQDAGAIVRIILARYADRLPVVTMKLNSHNEAMLTQMLSRDLGDRITITDSETGISAPFSIERIEHDIRGTNTGDPVHYTTFTCEQVPEQPSNVFRFDVAGRGFNQGVFGIQGLDDPDTVFRFDVAGQGFNDGVFAT
jgi:hypothetical protein